MLSSIGAAGAPETGKIDKTSKLANPAKAGGIDRRDGGMFLLSDGLAEAISVALAAARWTAGRTDPTVGHALISLGYDRDFTAVDPDGSGPVAPATPAPGWRRCLPPPRCQVPWAVNGRSKVTAKWTV